MLSTPSCVSFKLEQPPEQQRPHLGNRRAHRMPVLAEHIPENDRAGFAFEIGRSRAPSPRSTTFGLFPPGLAHPGQIAFHVGHENRNAARAEIFRERLQRHGFARAGRAGDEAVAVRHFRQEINWFLALRDKDWVVHKKGRYL